MVSESNSTWNVFLRETTPPVGWPQHVCELAWTLRHDDDRAWREICRMHGVVLSCLQPGEGPATPADFVQVLSTPLGDWAPLDGDMVPQPLRQLIVLHSDVLTDEAIDYGSEYTEALFDSDGVLDTGQQWLPPWSHQTREQAERSAFTAINSGSQAQYAAGRRMLIEVPTGAETALLMEYSRRGAPRLDVYEPIGGDRTVSVRDRKFWWPCPGCRYPMQVHGSSLRCQYPPHGVHRYFLQARGRGQAPEAINGPVSVARMDAEGIYCLRWGVWRFISVPGLAEVLLTDWLNAKPGVTAEPWPEKDDYDIGVHMPDGQVLRVDLKDVADARKIISDPPAAEHIVVTDHYKATAATLREHLPKDRYNVHTVSAFKRMITTRLRGGR
ncbi:hypothetical protein [Acrocarpospora sp. B8E8]|uniref:restriction endonuclease-related protein n=1 Tax=Acrocarpospora sp. B8E8 TaxID=3153572 RepID=UPI00325F77EE